MLNSSALAALKKSLQKHPRVSLASTPTPIEHLKNISATANVNLLVKRDDCTGVGLGGNKIRQLEFYVGDALANDADTLLITGAIQSNFTRSTAAVAAKLGLQCHVQLEQRVPNFSELYRKNGNVLLSELFGATFSCYPDGEDEQGADNALQVLAQSMHNQGRQPYIIRLGAEHEPTGALGYVQAAIEFVEQTRSMPPIDEIFIASGSALTHIGLLFGLRAMGDQTKVTGVCVRRAQALQKERVRARLQDLATLLRLPNHVQEEDIVLSDIALSPGYGRVSVSTQQTIEYFAAHEGLLLDPVYTAKVADAALKHMQIGDRTGRTCLLWHTGGQPALFAYANQLSS